jgi:hypothetical protein
MQQVIHCLNQHTTANLIVSCGWIPIWFGWLFYRHKKYGIVFPKLPPEEIRFHEGMASGRSFKTFFTRIGGARKCLRVTVTNTEVWIRPFFPICVYGAYVRLGASHSAQPHRKRPNRQNPVHNPGESRLPG